MWTDTAEVDMTLIKLTYHFYQHENLGKAFIAQLNSSCPITVAYLVCLSMPLFKIMVPFIYVCICTSIYVNITFSVHIVLLVCFLGDYLLLDN